MTDVRFSTKFWYGLGELSHGIKNFAFQLMLLYYYNQVLGVEAGLVGLVLMLALLFDALTDPLVGAWSDGLQSRWGRRHGFIYAAALPLGVGFYFLFVPPDHSSQAVLLLWLLFWVVFCRTAMTLYYVPHMALGAELSMDYHQRTSIVAYRMFFGLLGAVVLVVLSRAVFLSPTAEHPAGQSNPAGYPPMGLWIGLLMAVAILASALGTHDRIPHLAQVGRRTPLTLRAVGSDFLRAQRNRSFRAFFFGLLLFTIGRGLDMALWMYVGTFFYKLGASTQLVPLASLLGLLVGTVLCSRIRIEKRRLFIGGVTGYSVLTMLLPVCKLVGAFPAQGSSSYTPLIFGVTFVAAMFGAGPTVAGASMVADVADEHELTTGLRQEGIFFGAVAFALKASAGVGNWLGAVALGAIAFPTQIHDPSAVDPSKVQLLALVYGPMVMLIAVPGILVMRGYHLTATRHREIRQQLAARKAQEAQEALQLGEQAVQAAGGGEPGGAAAGPV